MRSLRDQDGFSLVELLASCLLLLVGILGVVASLNTSRDMTSTAEVREAAAHRAERELERIRALPYTSLGLTGEPVPRPQWEAASAANGEQLVTGGTVPPKQTFDDGRLRGELYVSITAYDDPEVTTGVDARRVVVAVVPTGEWKLKSPVVASTIVAAPVP